MKTPEIHFSSLFLTTLFTFLLSLRVGAQQAELVVPAGHTDAITCMDVSGDETFVLTGGNDRRAKLWNKEERLVRTFPAHPKGLIDVGLSPNKNYMVTRCDSLTRVVSLSGEILFELPTIAYYPVITMGSIVAEKYDAPAFSKDGQYVVIRKSDSTSLVFNPQNRSERLIRSTSRQNAGFSPNGQVYLAQDDREVVLYNQQWLEVKRFRIAEPNGHLRFESDEVILLGYRYPEGEGWKGKLWRYDVNGQLLWQSTREKRTYLPRGTEMVVNGTIITKGDGTTEIQSDTSFIPVERSFIVTWAGDPIYDSYWNVLEPIPNTSLWILHNEFGYEIWDLASKQLSTSSSWQVEEGYPAAIDPSGQALLIRQPENAQGTWYDFAGNALLAWDGLFSRPRRDGRRTTSWDQPLQWLPKRKAWLVGNIQGELSLYASDYTFIRPFGKTNLRRIKYLRVLPESDEILVVLPPSDRNTEETALVFDLEQGYSRSVPIPEAIRQIPPPSYIYKPNFLEFYAPDNVHRQEKYHLSADGRWLISGVEHYMTHYPAGSAVFDPSEGVVTIVDREKNKMAVFRPTGSVADVLLTRDNQTLLLAQTFEEPIYFDFNALISGLEWMEVTDQKDALSIKRDQSISNQKLAGLPVRTVLFDGIKDQFLHTKLTADFGGRGYIVTIDNAFYRTGLNGQRLETIEIHDQEMLGASYLNNPRFIASWSKDQVVRIYDTEKKAEVADLFFFNENDWLVTTEDGLFDASPGAMNLLYYVVGTEIIELEQLKTRYYEPGLLQKILAYSDEPTRPVTGFSDLPLFPAVEASINEETLTVSLKERSGGIGQVSVFINGKEVVNELNPLQEDQQIRTQTSLYLDLKPYRKFAYQHPDSANRVGVIAYNAEGWLKSPMKLVAYKPVWGTARGTGSRRQQSTGYSDPKLYVISVGTSDYSGTKLDLRYADQDATMMAKALQTVGTSLFTNGDSLEVHCFSTARPDSTGLEGTQVVWHPATKENIKTVFYEIATRAKAEDVLVVYLSGHGVTYGRAEHTQFHYLTRGIASEDLSDRAIREAFTISSEELTHWIKSVPALKQVLMVDACNSGKIVENLTGGSKNLNSSQIRAMDRMKDRTGMFVLSGSAADKVSYEASQFGQGLLTYALLEGIRGLATRQEATGEYVDVMNLFQYAADEVPRLAAQISGIQRPMIGIPNMGASFDIGILDQMAKRSIPKNLQRPIFIKSTFMDLDSLRDHLNVGAQIEAQFRRESERGTDASLLYVDVSNYPGAFYVNGYYQRNAGGEYTATVKLFQDDKGKVLNVRRATSGESLSGNLWRAIRMELRKNRNN